MGFIPIDGSSRVDNDIALTQIKSNTSTGARKPNQALEDANNDGTQTPDEKGGLFHRHAGRRRKAKKEEESSVGRQGSFGANDELSLNAMGRLYNKIINFSVVTRYLIYVLPVALILIAPLVTLSVLDPNEEILVAGSDDARPSLFRLFLWIMITWLTLWAGKIVAHFLPPIFMFFCGVVSSGTRKYATVLKALEIPLSIFFWALATWLSFRILFRNFLELGWVETLYRILGALFVSSAILLAEKTVVQLISITYHQRSFANRIKESKREVFLLGLMYDASRTLFPMYCPEFAEEDYVINDSLDLMLTGGKKSHKRGGSAAPMRIIGDVGRFGDKLTSVFGNIASEITGKQVFNPNSAHSIVVEALEKAGPSEALAKRIWMSFVVEGNEVLYADDLIEVLGPARKEEAEECFGAIDADENGDISLDEMVRKVLAIAKERKDIGNSMKDISQALTVFDKVLLFVVFLIVVIVFLIFFQSSVVANIAAAGTALLSLSFVFAVTAQEFLGSCIFLFVKHPFDVGDRVDIRNGPERQQLQVEKISLLYTVFYRIDVNQLVQIPNIVLNALWIENISRAKNMKEVIDLNVSFDTTFEDIEFLREEMEKFVRNPDNARDFQQDFSISCGGVGDLDKLNLKIAIKHKSNWHNDGVRATRRSKFMCALALALKRVPIYGPGGGSEALGSWKNPAYNVAVTDNKAKEYRQVADDDKEAKRMVPTPQDTEEDKLKAEEKAITEITSRAPILDADGDWEYDRDEYKQATGLGLNDDKTLTSRDQSRDRADPSNVSYDIHKKESKSGRRRAGDTVPLSPVTDNHPGIQVTQSSPPPSRQRTYDEESALGSNPYTSSGANPYAEFTATQSGHSMYQRGSQGSLPPQLPQLQTSHVSQQQQQQQHPHGSRHRGQSISRPGVAGTSQQQPPAPQR
ncbi:Mechanosensitive ion channel-domain-containing protein [Zalerion maritima]|uniref:Mechanosensitive ion channel-domain-containing protein n=1 Tax=Zalerion maritima TaxID=339359 RepID=A0AAD5RQL1_9PEZI|nr:Mechanosensitive ion channel-domain-containing protein [Zalerion maritima]